MMVLRCVVFCLVLVEECFGPFSSCFAWYFVCG